MTRLSLVVGLVLLIVGAVLSLNPPVRSDPVVDGWSVGDVTGCPRGATTCDDVVEAGLQAFDERDPAHPAVARWEIHAEGIWRDPTTGDQILNTRSGSCCSVLVLQLVDGTTAAVGVGYPGISQVPIGAPWGPHKALELPDPS